MPCNGPRTRPALPLGVALGGLGAGARAEADHRVEHRSTRVVRGDAREVGVDELHGRQAPARQTGLQLGDARLVHDVTLGCIALRPCRYGDTGGPIRDNEDAAKPTNGNGQHGGGCFRDAEGEIKRSLDIRHLRSPRQDRDVRANR